MGIRDRPISPGSPWQNGYAERLIGTVRRECLDRLLIFGESHLRRALASYAAYSLERHGLRASACSMIVKMKAPGPLANSSEPHI
jgi:transposase InsO family protein